MSTMDVALVQILDDAVSYPSSMSSVDVLSMLV